MNWEVDEVRAELGRFELVEICSIEAVALLLFPFLYFYFFQFFIF